MQSPGSIREIAAQFDAIIFDQWGVLHDGSVPYPESIAAIEALRAAGVRMGVLSNSGKRAEPNRARITAKGFPPDAFERVMTSGEALWQDLASGALGGITSLHAITAAPDDAYDWCGDLSLILCDADHADAILLMGLPDAEENVAVNAILTRARHAGKRLICSNPDRASPRGKGKLVQSPGALAHAFQDAGGDVVFYGKPHAPVFTALATSMGLTDPARILMVGDSPEHDIAGAQAVGWKSLFIQRGLHQHHSGPVETLFADQPLPDYTLPELR